MSRETCGCPKGYPLIDSKVRHTGRCPLSDETLAAYAARLVEHEHQYVAVERCTICGQRSGERAG